MDAHGANLARREDVEMHLMPDGSALLYDPDRNAGYALSPLGSLVWDMCDGTYTAEMLLAELEHDLAQVQGIRENAGHCLSEFARLGLLTAAPDAPGTPTDGGAPSDGISAVPLYKRASTPRRAAQHPKTRAGKRRALQNTEAVPLEE
jgi:hypothetical protein